MTTTQPGAPDDAEHAGQGQTSGHSLRGTLREIREGHARFSPTENLISNLSTVLLATAALATSWSSYQASIWSGKQSAYYSEAAGLRNEASRWFTRAGEERMIDIGLFNSWLQAYANGQDTVESFIRSRFRPEFAVAFDQWRVLRPLKNPTAPRSPFQTSAYRLASIDSGNSVDRRGDSVFAVGQSANDHSDGYVLTAVIFAAVLFLGGIAGQLGPLRTRFILLALAALLCIVGLVQLCTYPVSR